MRLLPSYLLQAYCIKLSMYQICKPWQMYSALHFLKTWYGKKYSITIVLTVLKAVFKHMSACKKGWDLIAVVLAEVWNELKSGGVRKIWVSVGKQFFGFYEGNCGLVVQDWFINFKTFDKKLFICVLSCCVWRLQPKCHYSSFFSSTLLPPPNNREILGQ